MSSLSYRSALIILFAVAPASLAQTTQRATHLSGREVRRLLHNAHSNAERRQLSTLLHQRALNFQARAKEQEGILDEELRRPSLGAKFPSRADSARRLSDYYRHEAEWAEKEAKALGA